MSAGRQGLQPQAPEAGGQFIFWVADWFALMNDKMGGALVEKLGEL